MLGINEAGQAHGNAVHLRRVGAIERLQRGEKVLLRVVRGGDAARIRPVQLLVHHRVFDLSAAYVKDHNFHTRCLLFCTAFIMTENKRNVNKQKTRTAAKQSAARERG